MKSILYAIADAGGNIYPQTFEQTADLATSRHIFNQRGYGRDIMPVGEVDQRWIALRKQRGDHVVKCSIETSENVTVTQIPL